MPDGRRHSAGSRSDAGEAVIPSSRLQRCFASLCRGRRQGRHEATALSPGGSVIGIWCRCVVRGRPSTDRAHYSRSLDVRRCWSPTPAIASWRVRATTEDRTRGPDEPSGLCKLTLDRRSQFAAQSIQPGAFCTHPPSRWLPCGDHPVASPSRLRVFPRLQSAPHRGRTSWKSRTQRLVLFFNDAFQLDRTSWQARTHSVHDLMLETLQLRNDDVCGGFVCSLLQDQRLGLTVAILQSVLHNVVDRWPIRSACEEPLHRPISPSPVDQDGVRNTPPFPPFPCLRFRCKLSKISRPSPDFGRYGDGLWGTVQPIWGRTSAMTGDERRRDVIVSKRSWGMSPDCSQGQASGTPCPAEPPGALCPPHWTRYGEQTAGDPDD